MNKFYINGIERIQFGPLTSDTIRKNSSIKEENGIDIPETYDSGVPKRGGLVDTRLGITDGNLQCAYCGLNANDCPGHFGHTKLATPVFHAGYISYVKNILGCICLKSSKLLIDINDPKYSNILKKKDPKIDLLK